MEPFRQKGSLHREAPLFLRVHTAKPLKYEQKWTLFQQKKKKIKHTLLWLFINVNTLFQKLKHKMSID